jgi:hypothetical protein
VKRLWIGIGLLAGILIAGLWTSAKLGEIHTAISDTLTAAAEAAQDGRWQQADELAQKAEESWQDRWNFSAALADHTIMDEIDGFFAEAKIYRENRNGVAYAAICGRLSIAIEALQEGHRLTWRNLL